MSSEPIKGKWVDPKKLLKGDFTVITEFNEEQFGFEKGATKQVLDELFGKTEDAYFEVIESKQLTDKNNKP